MLQIEFQLNFNRQVLAFGAIHTILNICYVCQTLIWPEILITYKQFDKVIEHLMYMYMYMYKKRAVIYGVLIFTFVWFISDCQRSVSTWMEEEVPYSEK